MRKGEAVSFCCPVWINNAEERTGGRSSSLGTNGFIPRLWLEGDTPLTLLKRRIKKKPSCAGISHRGFLFPPSIRTPEGFIVPSKPHLSLVLGQAQRERSFGQFEIIYGTDAVVIF